jgi:hypothetical protein
MSSQEAAELRPDGLPNADEVNHRLIHDYHEAYVYDPLSGDYDAFVHLMNQVAPVQADFVPTVTPSGGPAPKEIRSQWVGLSLPVRSKQFVEKDQREGFVVRSREALEILKDQRPEAYEWWRDHYIKNRAKANIKAVEEHNKKHDDPKDPFSKQGEIYPKNPDFPEWGANCDWFVFYPEWGILLPRQIYAESLAKDTLVKSSGSIMVRHTAVLEQPAQD